MNKSDKILKQKTKIDLHRYYPLKYKKDTFYEVPIEVAETLENERLKENNDFSKLKYYIKYSLDLNDYVSRTYSITSETPETYLLNQQKEIEKEDDKKIQDENVEVILYILNSLNSKTEERFLKYALDDKKIVEIAKEEHVNHSSVSRSIKSAKKNIIKKLDTDRFKYRLIHMGIILFDDNCKKDDNP